MRQKARHLSRTQQDERVLRRIMIALYGLPMTIAAAAGFWGLAGLLGLLTGSVLLACLGRSGPSNACRSDVEIQAEIEARVQMDLPLID